MDRRRFIHAVSLGSLTAIAGCGGNEVEDSDNGGTYNTTTSVIKGTDARTERTTHNKPVSESWTKELKRRIGQGHHFPRPTVNNGTLFISAGLNEEGTIYALDSDTGDTQWSYRVRASVLGYRVLPIIDKNLFVPQSGKLLAINIKKEELEWRTDAGVNTEIITDGKNLVVSQSRLEFIRN